ncbi:uncharacterized protein LOC143298314 [Babylonia areolata]|uniref:uncharacterized protein LOC143298314 n=1 Tax=Babylonia areolata TaxID=304850 RepID=UPI003FCEFB76
MEINRATNALKSTIDTVEADIRDILQSGDYYCTEEIARELNAINNGLEHLRLDSTLLGSEDWQKTFNPRNTAASISGATSILDRAAARLFDYKSQLRAVPMAQKQENEVREDHQWAMTTLLHIQKDLEPYTYGAADRIRKFGDHVGVTDRYLGYRNNLTRGPQEPSRLQTYWMDKEGKTGFMNRLSSSGSSYSTERPQRPKLLTSGWGSVKPDHIGSLGKQVRFSNEREPMTIFRGYRTIDSLYPRSNTMTAPGVRAGGTPNYSEHVENIRFLNAVNNSLATQQPTDPTASKETPLPGRFNMTPQERAGINTTFPGHTEYMDQYAQPVNTPRCTDLPINPRPDTHVRGRPPATALCTPSNTEYKTSYEWPDGNKINTCPWALID